MPAGGAYPSSHRVASGPTSNRVCTPLAAYHTTRLSFHFYHVFFFASYMTLNNGALDRRPSHPYSDVAGVSDHRVIGNCAGDTAVCAPLVEPVSVGVSLGVV